jgi:anhydro-N-acetylmuramic acid kinase
MGLRCGTSLDGIDVAYVEAPTRERLEELRPVAHRTVAFGEVDAARVREIAAGANTTAEELSALRFALARDEEVAVRALASEVGLDPAGLDYVASHGITLCHRPKSARPHGWQLHAGAVLAARLGVRVVDEFRAADLALSGQGAPLAPLADFALRRDRTEDRAILNLGGIANLTLLPRDIESLSEVICGDVGPANLPLDALCRERMGRDFDARGEVASRGVPSAAALDRLLGEAWVGQPLPRSFGREEFGAPWVRRLEAAMPEAAVEDLLATVVALEVEALRRFVERFGPAPARAWACYLTGGGRHNQAWLTQAQRALPEWEFRGIEDLGVSPDAKEAVDFAFLGGQTLRRRGAGQSSLTGASRDLVLGSIHDPEAGH